MKPGAAAEVAMGPDRENFSEPTELEAQSSFPDPSVCPSWATPAEQSCLSRQFEFRPIVGPHRQSFGIEMLFRAGWEDPRNDPGANTRIMLDNCLLYGFDELPRGRTVFLTCTREILVSGLLTLMPRTVVCQIPESVEADDEVVSACRKLKRAGFRLALKDFGSLEAMDGFLRLVDFIKVDFQHPVRTKRACLLRRLSLTDAALIAERIESEEDFRNAVEDGFELFQGSHCGENVVCANKISTLDPVNCMGILEALDWPDLSIGDLASLISLEPGIERRILRKARWMVPYPCEIRSPEEALLVIARADVHRIVNLAIEAASEECVNQALASESPRSVDTQGDDALIRWFEMGAKAPWWWGGDGAESELH